MEYLQCTSKFMKKHYLPKLNLNIKIAGFDCEVKNDTEI